MPEPNCCLTKSFDHVYWYDLGDVSFSVNLFWPLNDPMVLISKMANNERVYINWQCGKRARINAVLKAVKRATESEEVWSKNTPVSKNKKLKRAPVLKTRTCPRCKVVLLSADPGSFCCGRNLKCPGPAITLPKVSAALLKLFVVGLFAQHRRQHSNYFAFSATGSSNGVERIPGGPSNLFLHGRMHHRI